jgi:xanthine dehydrogenase small subunit
VSAAGHRVAFSCNDEAVETDVAAGESLLSVLRERLGIVSAKDGCAPQGQCGCCTVLVDGEPRVACVTPAARVAGRAVTTVEGLDPRVRSELVSAFLGTGGSQCGFCTPGILVRAAALRSRDRGRRVDVDRALAAHLCRCTGWETIHEALAEAPPKPVPGRGDAAARRARLEGGVAQRVGNDVPLGGGGFADDSAPRDALVAVPLPPGSDAPAIDAAGGRWVLAGSLHEARVLAAKVQGRRTPAEGSSPLSLPALPVGGVRLATSWVEPAYLEPDASWCEPGGTPATPLANGGAFGGKATSVAPRAARELADAARRAVRVVYSREDVVRLGPKRPPVAAAARLDRARLHVEGVVAGPAGAFAAPLAWPYAIEEVGTWSEQRVPGPATAEHLRAVGFAERSVLLEGALAEAGADRRALVRDERAARVLLDSCARAPSGALAGAAVVCTPGGTIERVVIRVAAGDPLDETVVRSYAIGAAHMALGWVLTEELTVDADTGEVRDLTIRSFGVIRARATPPIEVTILDDAGEPLARSSDAVFAATAGAVWNSIAECEGARPERLPARDTAAARALRG